ncbi:HlyD family type I secretion periplasmic adaptor subunit [Tateyamaria omphalii]|uniref:HlyD family type I secretion periplasmic adaptor subunit n=1 Tax=Tateyamaria omphalii TaxID=299262 RepID=UPI001C99852B|nr:HlyD family type I secretion periplasmic adaptor subunit [Tateyamaria omphalii]MBY5935404.1 HlyD family type I secretion periplasmic adaptor subunit [Tateyamaria omphalii]
MSEKRWSALTPLIIGFFGLFGLLGGLVAWATLTQIAGAVIASGRIEVDQNRQIVQHSTGGIVSEIAVKEGDSVDAGDLLIQLDVKQMQSSLAIVESQLYEFMARRGRLEAERDEEAEITFEEELLAVATTWPEVQELVTGQENLFRARRESTEKQTEQLAERAAQTRNQIKGIEAQEKSLGRQLELIEQELAAQESLLERGLTQASGVLALQRQQASLDGQIGELAASKAQSEQRITEIEIEVLRLNSTRREEAITTLRDLRARELELIEQRQALLTDIERMEIRAPVSGIVYNMRVQTPRSVVRAADPVLFLIPQDRPLVIAARVDPIHIDQIVTGQSVNLRFSALDQRTTPELVGEVVLVSADAFEDENVGASFYRAEIVLNPGEIDRLNENQVLVPGMPVEAFIRTADRSPLAYLVKPVADYFNRAFRES